MKRSDFYWLVGLLEGEGSFMRGPPSNPHRPRVALQMTDRDVVQRAADIMGGTCLLQKKSRRNANWKRTYFVGLRGSKAVRLMSVLKPHLSMRRQAQVSNALRGYVFKEPGHPRVLSPRKVRAIRASTKTVSELAKHYAVSRPTIKRVKDRKIWKHVS